MSANVPAKKKPRRWRWLLRAAGVLLALALVALGSLWLRLEWEAAKGREQLAAAIAQADEEHPRWRWEQIQEDLAPIPDAENSVLVIMKAKASFAGWEPGKKELPDGGRLFDPRPQPNVRLDEPRLALLREELAPLDPAVTLAVSLKDYPRGRATIQLSDNVIGTRIPHAQAAREVAYLLEMDCERLLHADRGEDVPDRIRAMLCASASLRDDPFLISAVVQIVVRIMAVRQTERALGMGRLTDEECRRLASLLEAQSKENLLLPAARGERAVMFRLMENVAAGKVPLTDVDDLTSDFEQFVYRYRLPEDRAVLLARHNRICEIAALPVEQQRQACAAFDAEWRAEVEAERERPDTRHPFSERLTPNMEKVAAAVVRGQAQLRCALGALAAERFRLKHGRWPKTLDELCPAFLPAVPIDPYSDGPLSLDQHEDGISISAGREDGGEIEFRLFDPDKRNLPAEPKKIDD